jgi:tRNA pseudouridine38-40 synthase
MRYLKLTIAYDGTDFHGWQIQSGKPTIQGEIVAILRRLTQENIAIHGAVEPTRAFTRWDRWPVFARRRQLSTGELQRALNALLPQTIRIMAVEETGPDFNARWSARGENVSVPLVPRAKSFRR